jgi:hypothetical protein
MIARGRLPGNLFDTLAIRASTMVDLPGRTEPSEDEAPIDGDVAVTCAFQDGSLYVGESSLYIDRSARSQFDDKQIDFAGVRDVTYERRLVISYLQIEQDGVEPADGSLLSTPVDENTLHFGRGKRDCARRARDAIRDGAGVW